MVTLILKCNYVNNKGTGNPFVKSYWNLCGKMKYSSVKWMSDNDNKNNSNYYCAYTNYCLTGCFSSPWTLQLVRK